MTTKDKEKQDEWVLKLTGKAALPKPLTIGYNFRIQIDGSITAITEQDNDDGSRTFYYKFEPVLVEGITEKGERIKAKDVRQQSKRLRAYLYREWDDANVNVEFEEYYNQRMAEIIAGVIEGTK